MHKNPQEDRQLKGLASKSAAKHKNPLNASMESPSDAVSEPVNRACETGTDGKTAIMDSPSVHSEKGQDSNDNSEIFTVTPEQLLGTQCGSYVLTEIIGQGGMGYVFLGERHDGQFQQTVAVKILQNAQFASSDILQRFKNEQQFLASLNHPNIARILDGGISPDGLPYFIMEYVQGLPITEFVKQHQLTVKERLSLFTQVCEAVQFSHRNLIIHRDLKPANILVSPERQVKLLDFGIAKASELEPSGVQAPQTKAGQLIATPAYASPEALQGSSVTICSDVYSLGLILYELLLGEHPFCSPGCPPIEAMYRMMQVQPVKPSTLTGSVTSQLDLDTVQTEPTFDKQKLKHMLRGDLDTICVKTLQKEPERRYHSVDQLQHDIQQYLLGRPILARPDTLRYRYSKFYQRNQLISWLSIILIGTLIGFSFTMWQQVKKIRIQNIEIALERDRAERTSEFLTDLFLRVDPYQFESEPPTAKSILDNGARLLQTSLDDSIPSKSQLLKTIGFVYSQLGQFREAEACLIQAVELSKSVFGVQSSVYIDAMHGLAQVKLRQAQYQEGLCILDQLGVTTETVLTTHDKFLPDMLSTRATLLAENGDLNEAEYIYTSIIDFQRTNPNTTKHDLLQLAKNLTYHGSILQQKNQFSAAEELYLEALDLRRQLVDSEHPRLAESYNNLGSLYSVIKKLDKAEWYLKKGLSLLENLYSPNHPSIITLMNNLAGVQKKLGYYTQSEATYRDVLSRLTKEYGVDHPYVAGTKNNLGLLLNRMGKPNLAEPLIAEGIRFYRARLGDEHINVGILESNYGTILHKLDKDSQAVTHYRTALRIFIEARGPSHPLVSLTKSLLATCLQGLNETEEANALWEQAYAAFKSDPESHKNHKFSILINGAILKRHNMKYEEALTLLDQIQPMEKDHTDVLSTMPFVLIELIHCHLALNHPEEARSYLEQSDILAVDIPPTPYSIHVKLNKLRKHPLLKK